MRKEPTLEKLNMIAEVGGIRFKCLCLSTNHRRRNDWIMKAIGITLPHFMTENSGVWRQSLEWSNCGFILFSDIAGLGRHMIIAIIAQDGASTLYLYGSAWEGTDWEPPEDCRYLGAREAIVVAQESTLILRNRHRFRKWWQPRYLGNVA